MQDQSWGSTVLFPKAGVRFSGEACTLAASLEGPGGLLSVLDLELKGKGPGLPGRNPGRGGSGCENRAHRRGSRCCDSAQGSRRSPQTYREMQCEVLVGGLAVPGAPRGHDSHPTCRGPSMA